MYVWTYRVAAQQHRAFGASPPRPVSHVAVPAHRTHPVQRVLDQHYGDQVVVAERLLASCSPPLSHVFQREVFALPVRVVVLAWLGMLSRMLSRMVGRMVSRMAGIKAVIHGGR